MNKRRSEVPEELYEAGDVLQLRGMSETDYMPPLVVEYDDGSKLLGTALAEGPDGKFYPHAGQTPAITHGEVKSRLGHLSEQQQSDLRAARGISLHTNHPS